MRRMILASVFIFAGAGGLVAAHVWAPPKFDSSLFSLIADIPLGPAANRIDYQSVDPQINVFRFP